MLSRVSTPAVTTIARRSAAPCLSAAVSPPAVPAPTTGCSYPTGSALTAVPVSGCREFTTSRPPQHWMLVGGLGVAAAAMGARYAVEAWNQYQSQPAVKRKPVYRGVYQGGFMDEMTRREAALILGVRESAAPSRIKERHRALLMANHPDTGGSTFVAAKINDAKELLLKGAATK